MKNSLFVICLLFLFSCNQESDISYKSKKGYHFSYSNKEWKIEELKEYGSLTVLLNLLEEKSNFISNINIAVQDLSSMSINLEEYHNLTIKQIEQVLGKDAIQSDKNIKISDISGKEIIYTMPKNLENGNLINLKLKQVYFIKNNKAYLITYTAKVKDFETYLKSANKVFETFKVN